MVRAEPGRKLCLRSNLVQCSSNLSNQRHNRKLRNNSKRSQQRRQRVRQHHRLLK